MSSPSKAAALRFVLLSSEAGCPSARPGDQFLAVDGHAVERRRRPRPGWTVILGICQILGGPRDVRFEREAEAAWVHQQRSTMLRNIWMLRVPSRHDRRPASPTRSRWSVAVVASRSSMRARQPWKRPSVARPSQVKVGWNVRTKPAPPIRARRDKHRRPPMTGVSVSTDQFRVQQEGVVVLRTQAHPSSASVSMTRSGADSVATSPRQRSIGARPAYVLRTARAYVPCRSEISAIRIAAPSQRDSPPKRGARPPSPSRRREYSLIRNTSQRCEPGTTKGAISF